MFINRKLISALIFSFSIQLLSGQPHPRFNPFDWVLYSDIVSVRSISEGTSYTYMASGGGIIRYNIYGFSFEEPITTAQGLPSNNLTAIHYDHETGVLWVATDSYLCYSYNNMNDWHKIPFDDLSLTKDAEIIQIGSSRDYIWCSTPSNYVKCDHGSGIFLGSMVNPDESEIRWSSARIEEWDDVTGLLGELSFFGNWNIFGTGLIGPTGEEVGITSYLKGQYSDTWLGTSERVIFHSQPQIEILYPLQIGLNNVDVQFAHPDKGFWTGGRDNGEGNGGITYLDPRRDIYEHHDFDLNINMSPQSLFSALDLGKEIWFGGEGQVLVYKKKDESWRTLNELDGIPPGKILALASDKDYVWVGGTRGISRLGMKSKRHLPFGFEHFYSERLVNAVTYFDNLIWIGSNYYLRVFDLEKDTLVDLNHVYQPENKTDNYTLLRYFSAFDHNGEKLFIATTAGIISADRKSRTWKTQVNQTVYGGKFIRKIKVFEGYLWFVTANSLYRVDIEDGHTTIYNYDFMGTLNDLYINGDDLWLGTSEGLIKFIWTRDL